MRRHGARLTISEALGRQSALDPLQSGGQTNSASLSKAEKEIKVPIFMSFVPTLFVGSHYENLHM